MIWSKSVLMYPNLVVPAHSIALKMAFYETADFSGKNQPKS